MSCKIKPWLSLFYTQGADGLYRRRQVFRDHTEILVRDGRGRLVRVERVAKELTPQNQITVTTIHH